MTHTFDTEIAKKVGVNSAVILNHIVFWLEKNIANQQCYKMGRVWSYCSVKGLADIFTYLSPSQIRTAINKLIDANIIMSRQFDGYNRVNWYSLTDEAICEFPQFHLSKITNPFAKNDKCIYNIIDKDNSKDISKYNENMFSLHDSYPLVSMTQDEYDKLLRDYGGDEIVDTALAIYSAYKERRNKSGKPYNPNDYLAMRKWAFKAVKEQRPELYAEKPKQYTRAEYEKMVVEQYGKDSVEYDQMMSDFDEEV